MIGHAALMYRTERGGTAKSLEELQRADCCPGTYNKDDLVCPDGGTYTMSADGMHGVCSHHGHARHLVPCCETPLAWVYPDEAREYERFRNEYNNYWRTYFDPIALRIQVTPERYRVETIVLPLINNSIYTGLARMLGGKPEPLDALPVPKRNILSVAAHINKETLPKEANLGEWLGFVQKNLPVDTKDLLARGLGDQISLNLCDSPLLFDLDMPRFFNLMFGNFNANLQNLSNQDWLLTFLITSLNSPLYVAVPVRDVKVVDSFLKALDMVLASRRDEQAGLGWFSLDQDFYKNELPGGVTARCQSLSLGPVKWRFYWARIGSGLYVASKASVLKDLAEAEIAHVEGREKAGTESDTIAHGLVRLRARNWNQVLPDYRLGWAENNRLACLRNLGPLASAGRAVLASAEGKGEKNRQGLSDDMQRLADQMYAVHFFCPEGGQYLLSPDGRSCTCSVHGSARDPKQPLAANENNGPGKLLNTFGGLSASLTFLEDGLHAVVILERQK
jgi:hypothetical protein